MRFPTPAPPYRYAGYRFDEETGLYYCWNRYYDPSTARFITADLYPGELQSPVTMNAYAYRVGNPMRWVDPSGLFWEEVSTVASIVTTVSLLAGPAGWPAAIAWLWVTQEANDMAYQEREIGPFEHYAQRRLGPLGLIPGMPANLVVFEMQLAVGESMSDCPEGSQWPREQELLEEHGLDDMAFPMWFAPPDYSSG